MSIIDAMQTKENIPVVVVNQDGIIVFVNYKFEEVFGWKKKEIEGMPLTTIIPKNMHEAHQAGFSRFLRTERSKILAHNLTLGAVKKNGEEFIAEHFIQAEKINGAWMFVATIRPSEDLAK